MLAVLVGDERPGARRSSPRTGSTAGPVPVLNGGLAPTPLAGAGGGARAARGGSARPAGLRPPARRTARRSPRRGAAAASLDTLLVDGLPLEGVTFTPSAAEAERAVRAARPRLRSSSARRRSSRSRRSRVAGRAMPQKSTYFFPKLAERAPLLPVRRVTRLARSVPRRRAPSQASLDGAADARRARAGVGVGEGGDETAAVDVAAEKAVVARLESCRERHRLHARLRGARRARLRRRRRRRSASSVDPIDGSVNAKRGIPFFSALDRGRRRAGDGRRLLRLRPRLRLGRGVDGAARARARS